MKSGRSGILVAILAIVLGGCHHAAIESTAPVEMSQRTDKGQLEPVKNEERSEFQIELLHKLAQPGAPEEVFALERYSTWGGPGDIVEVAVKGGRAELFVREGARHDRYFYCWLSDEELRELRAIAKESDRFPGLEDQALDGVDYYFVHGSGKSLRKLHMNNPRVGDDIPSVTLGGKAAPDPIYARLVMLMRTLSDAKRLSVKYEFDRPVEGMEVVFADPQEWVQKVWARGDDVRVTLGRPGYVPQETWRGIRKGKLLDDEVEKPAPFPEDEWPEKRLFEMGYYYHLDSCDPWQARAAGRSIHGMRNGLHDATFFCEDDKEPVKIFDDLVRYPLLTADGKWMVGRVKDKLIRYDIDARKMSDVEGAANFLPLRFVPAQGKVMIVRHERTPLGKLYSSDFRMLDAATGKSEEVRPDERVWLQPLRRFFQPTKEKDVVWVAFSDKSKHTMVGRYDTKKLKFLNWFRVESLEFLSDKMWVDEDAGWVYAIFDGHLLRVPVDKSVYTNWEN